MLTHPVASNCLLGRFWTIYNHVTAESRCPLGTPESTAEAKAGWKLAKRFRRKLFRLVVQVSRL